MTPEQKAAFINAQTALLNCEVAGMIAENQARQRHNWSLAYEEAAFDSLFRRYAPILNHEAILNLFENESQNP